MNICAIFSLLDGSCIIKMIGCVLYDVTKSRASLNGVPALIEELFKENII